MLTTEIALNTSLSKTVGAHWSPISVKLLTGYEKSGLVPRGAPGPAHADYRMPVQSPRLHFNSSTRNTQLSDFKRVAIMKTIV